MRFIQSQQKVAVPGCERLFPDARILPSSRADPLPWKRWNRRKKRVFCRV